MIDATSLFEKMTYVIIDAAKALTGIQKRRRRGLIVKATLIKYIVVMLKDISHIKMPTIILKSDGFFLAIYKITTPEIVINPIIIIVLRYGAGFVNA